MAEDALRTHEQHDDEHDESPCVLQFDREVDRGNLGDNADDEAPHDHTVGRTEAPEDDPGEHEQQQLEAHVPGHELDEPEEDAAKGGERPRKQPHVEDDPRDVDPRRLGQIAVVSDGPDGLAHPGALEHEADAGQYEHRKDDDYEIAGGDGNRAPSQRLLDRVVGVGQRPAAEHDQDDVPDHQGQADRHDKQLNP